VDVHESIPEVASLPLNLMSTGSLYHPFTSASRDGVPAVATGGFWSSLILSWTVTVATPSSALQSSFVPGVSAVYVLSWQPTVAASEGRTVQSMETFERYQPEQSCGAGVHL
jgi:hypothetical protein